MRRHAFIVGVFVLLGMAAGRAHAQYPYPQPGMSSGAYRSHGWGTIWLRNNSWPEPFLTQDRQAVRAPFAVMVEKGWQIQNTLGDHHFDAETQQLTRAGELHLKWIVQQTPENRRTVFVLRGHNEASTTIRVDTVQQAVAQFQPRGSLPAVVQTNNAPPASPAEYVHDVNEKAIKARPAPALPAATGVSGGASGGSGM